MTLRIGNYKKILFCTDFSKQADVALDYAIDAATRNDGAQLMILHVFQEPDVQFWRTYMSPEENNPTELIGKIVERIENTYRPLIPPEVPFFAQSLIGDPVQTILNYVESESIDLLVMGRARRAGITNWLLGNIMGRVAAKAECPTLIVPVAED